MAANSSIPEPGRLHPWLRALLAGPCALGLTALIIAVMPFWVPKEAAALTTSRFRCSLCRRSGPLSSSMPCSTGASAASRSS